jgi:hypothetical protein
MVGSHPEKVTHQLSQKYAISFLIRVIISFLLMNFVA